MNLIPKKTTFYSALAVATLVCWTSAHAGLKLVVPTEKLAIRCLDAAGKHYEGPVTDVVARSSILSSVGMVKAVIVDFVPNGTGYAIFKQDPSKFEPLFVVGKTYLIALSVNGAPATPFSYTIKKTGNHINEFGCQDAGGTPPVSNSTDGGTVNTTGGTSVDGGSGVSPVLK